MEIARRGSDGALETELAAFHEVPHAITCASGTLAVEMGFEEYILRPNDSISFESTTPHRLRAVGDKPAVAVWAVIHRDGDARPDAFGA